MSMFAGLVSSVASAFLQKVMDAKATAARSVEPKAPSVEDVPSVNASTSDTDTASKRRDKKRSIEELSQACHEQPTAELSKYANTARLRANEPASKKARATLNKNKYHSRIKSMIRFYLDRHAAILSEHGKLPMAYSNRRRLAEDFEDIVFRTMNCRITSKLFADRMDELKLVTDELRELEGEKDSNDPRIKAQIRRASCAFDSQSIAFLDGPFLFHVFGSLQRDLRARLYELDLPLTEIKQLRLDLRKRVPGTLEQYNTTKKEAEVRSEEILQWLDPSYYDREPEAVSYDDTGCRNTHENCQDAIVNVVEVANATLAHTVGQMASSLEKALRAQAIPQHTPCQSTTPQVSSTVQPDALESSPRSQQADKQTVEDETSREIAINLAAQEKAHEKSLETSAHESQREETRRKKFLVDFHAYGTLIQQMKTCREGGPHPNRDFMKELGMHDIKSCVHRLKHLWNKHSRAVQAHDVELLRADASVYMETAICLREAHYILHMLLYYGSCWWDVAEAGWNLDQMRELQAEMVQWAHEDPLMCTKLDVDAICQALQDVCNQQAHVQASMPEAKGSSVAKKRDHPPRVYRQVPVTDQGIVSATTVALPGFNGVAFEQVTNKSTAPAPPLPTILECDGADSDDDMMDVDRAEHICRQFLHGKGCTLVDDVDDPCPYDHPYVRKLNSPCLYLFRGVDCPFGQTGCRYVHNNILLPIEQPQSTQNAAPQPSGARTTASLVEKVQELINNGMIQSHEAQYYVLAPSGDAVDTRVSGNYCNNVANNRCKTQHCRRIHQLNANQQVSGPSNPQQIQPQSGEQASQPPKACSYHVHGRCNKGKNCTFSHDPHVIFQAFKRYPPGHTVQIGDTRTGDSASSIDVRAQTPQKQPCKYEHNGPCTNKKCRFSHTNPQSATFRSGPPQSQGIQSGTQAPPQTKGKNTWTPTHGIHFAPPNNHAVDTWRTAVAHAPRPLLNKESKCFNCKQFGHKRSACPLNNHTNNSNNSGGQQSGSNTACFQCGKADHIARYCPANLGSQGGRRG